MCAGYGHCGYFNAHTLSCKKPRCVRCPNEDIRDPEPAFVPMTPEEKASLKDFLNKLEAGYFDHIFD